MAVNIKNARVELLLDEVAALTGETKTEAIRRALEDRRDRLVRHYNDAFNNVLNRSLIFSCLSRAASVAGPFTTSRSFLAS